MSRYTFQVGRTYKRSQIKKAIGLDPNAKGGPWDTGYAERNGADFIFCNVGIPGRTGHDYDNSFDASDLVWRGKTGSHRRQPTIQRMTGPAAEVHVFWRADERDPFTYEGLATAVDVSDERPVRVRWRFINKSAPGNSDTRSQERLPVEDLEKVTPEHVWNAVQMILQGYSEHQFGASTDYDLLVEEGVRLAPKSVFGVAAKLALGFEVLPRHFSGGDDSPCFRLLRNAGFTIVRQDEAPPSRPSSLSDSDQEWAEGKTRLVAHLVKERARGLAPRWPVKFPHLWSLQNPPP